MSLTESGFEPEAAIDILQRIVSTYAEILPDVSIEPSNPLYQWIKVITMEKLYIQNLCEGLIANMSPISASGIFLDYLANDYGIQRKEGMYSFGVVQVYGQPNGYTVAQNSVFSTINGIDFTSYMARIFSPIITGIRGSGSIDRIPSVFTGIQISGIYEDADLNVPFSSGVTGDYTYTDDLITWNSGVIEYGTSYYISVSGEMGVNVPVASNILGTGGNTAANTITVNTSSLPISSVDNNDAISNGVEIESDALLRYRILSTSNKRFTLENIRTIVIGVDGVRDCKVYQSTGVDRYSISDWIHCSSGAGSGTMQILSTGVCGFTFYPGTGIGTLAGIMVYGHVNSTGNIPDMYVYLTEHISGTFVEDTGGSLSNISTLGRGSLLQNGYTGWQDIYIPLKYNGLDPTRTYAINFLPVEAATTGACWEFRTHSGAEYTGYRFNSFSGSAYLGDTGLCFKTFYGLPAYNISVVPEVGYDFNLQIKPLIESLIDYETSGGYSPVCIQTNVVEATAVYLGLYFKYNILDGYTISGVSDEIKANVESYLYTITPGDDIIFSQIEKTILNTAGMKRLRDLQMRVNSTSTGTDGTWVTRQEELDLVVNDYSYVLLSISDITMVGV